MDAAPPKLEQDGEDGGEGRRTPRTAQDDPGRTTRWAAWHAENAAAIASSNAWVERHGLPLARFRLF